MEGSILLIEQKRAEAPTFTGGLVKKGYQIEPVTNGRAALEKIEENVPQLVIVNASSMRTTGTRICGSIRKSNLEIPIILVVDNVPDHPAKIDADVILVMPFTIQKLINRVKRYIPAMSKNIIKLGVLKLDLENRVVHIKGKQESLTPRLVMLLKTLIENNGEVIDRESLFKVVWDTTYTEDMRTLDVHISWLRQAIEDNPRKPRYLKTIRGIGYILEIPKR